MNFEHLQEVWARQPVGEVPLPDHGALLAKVKADSAEFDAIIRARDRRELLAGLKFAALFGLLGLAHLRTGLAWPDFTAMGCMLFVTCFLLGEKALAAWRRPPLADTLLGSLAEARDHLRRQVWLLRHVGWWYLLPAQGAWWLFGLGVLLNLSRAPARYWLPVALGQLLWTLWLWRGTAKVYRLNQDAVHRDLLPRLKKLDDLAAEWRQTD